MTIELRRPETHGLAEVVAVLREWHAVDAPVQLHPGDLGWHERFGAVATASAVRTWVRGGVVVAVGLLDGPGLLRLALAPDLHHDEALARRVVDDLSRPERDVVAPGAADLEAPDGALVRTLLGRSGWVQGEAWTPLRRDLTAPVEATALRVEVVDPSSAPDRVEVQRAAFTGSTFTLERWREMAAGAAYADARCLVGRDGEGAAVAAVTVWSAGPGRTGLVEPMGVHGDHRGRGHGTAVTLAGAAALRELGCSRAVVLAPRDNSGAVATYTSAGFEPLPDVHDLHRPDRPLQAD